MPSRQHRRLIRDTIFNILDTILTWNEKIHLLGIWLHLPDPDWHALDDQPDPAKWCGSERIRIHNAAPNCHVLHVCLNKCQVHLTNGVYFVLLLLIFVLPSFFYPFMLTGAAALFGVQRLDFGPSLLGSELLHTRTSELEHPPAHREGTVRYSSLPSHWWA